MTHYYELKTSTNNTLGAEIARHLAVRQDLGGTVVVCNSPFILLSVVRKTWLHLARQLQKQRAATLNPEEILRLTHTIMHMQRMLFVAKTPIQIPDAQVYFVTPAQLEALPTNCYTLYLSEPVPAKTLAKVIDVMPDSSLIVNFDVGVSLSTLGVRPKSELETRVLQEWHLMAEFLRRHDIQPAHLSRQNPSHSQAVDDTLDTLLAYSSEFLREANTLRHTIHLAQPFNAVSAEQQQTFDVIMRLAHRVQALSPHGFDNYLVRTFGEQKEDFFASYFLRDSSSELENTDVALAASIT